MPGTLPLSISIVCKDNAATIERTLESVPHDRGRDRRDRLRFDRRHHRDPRAILCPHHLERAWLGHVKTKQAATEACSLDWVLCIDSDESLDFYRARRIDRLGLDLRRRRPRRLRDQPH